MDSLIVDHYIKKGRKRYFIAIHYDANSYDWNYDIIDLNITNFLKIPINSYKQMLRDNFNACYSKRKRLTVFLNQKDAELALEWATSILTINKLTNEDHLKTNIGRSRIPSMVKTV